MSSRFTFVWDVGILWVFARKNERDGIPLLGVVINSCSFLLFLCMDLE